MKMHIPFISRQVLRSSKQASVFILCIALSLCSITAFSGFSYSVNRSLLNDARKLHAADIIIRSNNEISEDLNDVISKFVNDGRVKRARIYEFNSVVRTFNDKASVLADVKIVEKGYPFYGQVVLRTGRPFHDVLIRGKTVVDQVLLDRLGMNVGDALKIGYSTFIIDDVVTAEPDRPVEVFSFGPRVFVADEDRDALGLIEKGSRINFTHLLKVIDGSPVDVIAGELKNAAVSDRERVDTFQTARSRLKRFLDNFLFFLKLVGFFVMVVSGFGIQVTLTAFLNEKKTTIAIMKTVGATNRYVTRHFMLIVFVLGIIGIIMGLITGYMVQYILARMLTSFLPDNIQVFVSWSGILKGIFLGFAVVVMFTFLPLYQIKNTRPVMILRKDIPETQKKFPYVLSGLIFLSIFSGLVFWHMKDFQFGLYFIGGLCGLILATFLSTQLMLFFLKRMNIRQLMFRQAVKGLFRRGNATKPVVITLTASLCVIFSIYLIEQNLDASFIQSYPKDSPNLFFLDIQPAQLADFKQRIGSDITVYPVVQAQVVSINGKIIDRKKEGGKRRDNFSRVFNLTYRDDLLKNERIIQGKSLFREDWHEPQVSILDMVVDMRKISMGDKIVFNIQGVFVEARVSSIRTQEMESMSPFFYFVFPENILKTAPQTIFAALNVEKDHIRSLQNTIVSQFPNISVIDATEILKTFSKLMDQLSLVVRFFTLLSIIAGILILISAIFATRAERIIEAVYYKVLGARKSFVFKVFAQENMLIGILSGFLALVMAQTTAFMICKYTFEISYHFFFLSTVLMTVAAVLLVVVIGLATSQSILNKRPLTFLKEQPDG